MKKGENADGEEGREWRLPGLLFAYGLVLCGELEEELKGRVLGGEERSVC